MVRAQPCVVVVVLRTVVLVEDPCPVDVLVVPGEVVVVVEGVVVDVVDGCRSVVEVAGTVDDVLVNSGAETFNGDAGLWFTWASAAPTICHVTNVVSTRTRVHPPAREIKRTHQFSHHHHRGSVNGFLRIRQGGVRLSMTVLPWSQCHGSRSSKTTSRFDVW